MQRSQGVKAFALFLVIFASFFANGSVYRLSRHERLNFNPYGEIEICWMGVSHHTADIRQKIEDYLRIQLTGRVGLSLNFKEDCFRYDDPYYPVALAIFDDPGIAPGVKNAIYGMVTDRLIAGHPMTYSWGMQSERGLIDIVLTSRFESVLDRLKLQASELNEQGRENLILSIALHEMLHVLGFAHEQNHPDSACISPDQSFNPRVHEALTEYDSNSLLNYCLTHVYDFNLGPLPLSPLDIEGLQAVYGDYLIPAN